MAKHEDITKWDRYELGTAYMDQKVELELAERRLSNMTLADGTVPETRLVKQLDEINELRNRILEKIKNFTNFRKVTFQHMDWMTTDIKWKEDQLIKSHTKISGELRRRDNEEYSKELSAALVFVDKLKEE